VPTPKIIPLQICILAGGLSTRMGRDKSRVQINGQSMLAHIRRTARLAGGEAIPIRVIRRDSVARCGPLGGIFTALQTTKARAVLFLACDMPLVTVTLLQRVLRGGRDGERAIFVAHGRRVGFPCVLPANALPIVEQQIATGDFSLQSLARTLRARRVVLRSASRELLNVNTPDDLALAQAALSTRTSKPGK
jgi:molybdenum cofactor guanylyltransferase